MLLFPQEWGLCGFQLLPKPLCLRWTKLLVSPHSGISKLTCFSSEAGTRPGTEGEHWVCLVITLKMVEDRSGVTGFQGWGNAGGWALPNYHVAVRGRVGLGDNACNGVGGSWTPPQQEVGPAQLSPRYHWEGWPRDSNTKWYIYSGLCRHLLPWAS